MKTTKFLLCALAVTSFTACQNEEIVNDQQAVLPQDRAQVDVKVVSLNGVDSRMINNNGVFSWETTDKLGAAMVDVETEGSLSTGKHFGNALFNYENGEFTTASTLSTGAYVFYYPYNEDNTTTRAGVIVKDLGVQKFDATGEEMMKNNFMVAPIAQLGGAEAGELTLPMTFRSIYGYGNLTLTNNSTDTSLDPQDLEIQKIVIEETANQFVIGGKLVPSNVKTNNSNLYVDLRPSNANAEALFAKADSVYLDWDRNEDGTVDKASPVQWTDAANKGAVSISCLTGSTGIALKAGESISTRVLIPAGDYNKANIKITVYTNKGYFDLTGDAITSTDAANKFTVRNSRTKTIGANITGTPSALSGTINIVDKNDFVATMKQFQNQIGGDVKVKMVGNKTVDAEMLSIIPAKLETFTFANDVTIEANTTLSKIRFEEAGVVTLKGNVTVAHENTFNANTDVVLASGNLTIGKNVTAKTIEVKEGTTLNLASGINLNANIKNFAGTLNVGSTGGAAVNISYSSPITLTSGIVNINAQLNTLSTFAFGSDVEGAKALTLNVAKPVVNTYGEIYVYKSATVNNTDVFDVDSNNGKIVNGKTLTVITNNGTIDNNASCTLTVTTNKGTINNTGSATVTDNTGLSSSAKAVINQMATTSVLKVTNNNGYGKIVTVAGSTTTVETTQAGDVVYVEDALLAINASTTGSVVYEAADMTADQFAALKPIVNKVVITADYTMAAVDKDPAFIIPANITTIEFEGSATFNRPVKDNNEIVSAVNLVFNGDVNFAKGAEFAKGANMTFNGGHTLKGTLIKTGTDYVDGTTPIQPTNVTLTWNINNGYMKNYCPVNASDDTFNVVFGAAVSSDGILAGTIWNDPTTCKASTFTANPSASWGGQAVATGATTVPVP